jgi:hypothetical protein
MAGLFLPRFAAAHTPGLSTASFDVQPDGRVDARLGFASAEPLGGTSLDRNELRGFVLDGVDVSADGVRCAPTFRGATITEVDGLLLEASYACPPPDEVREIAATLYYLSALSPGHREVVRITAGDATNEAVLTGDRRAIALIWADEPPGKVRRRRGRLLVLVTTTFCAFLSGLFVWRWRATRNTRAR